MTGKKDTNSIGDAGVNKTVARLQVACFANVSSGSYSEDSMKNDVLFSFKNAFDEMELCKLGGQVKTGDSFISLLKDQRTARIDNCSDVKEVMAKKGLPIIIFIVYDQKNIHWYSGDVRSKKVETIKIPIEQIITPSVWIDYSRLHRYYQFQHEKYITHALSLKKTYVREGKNSFKEVQSSIIDNPVVGPISVTKKSWEHVTRQNRTNKMREYSIRSAKYLKHFLETNPDRIALKYITKEEKDGITYEKRVIIMHYRRGLKINNKVHSFAIRVHEIIEYPTDWVELTLTPSHVKHRRKVSSWWVNGMRNKNRKKTTKSIKSLRA